jgi:hypothetical protein
MLKLYTIKGTDAKGRKGVTDTWQPDIHAAARFADTLEWTGTRKIHIQPQRGLDGEIIGVGE